MMSGLLRGKRSEGYLWGEGDSYMAVTGGVSLIVSVGTILGRQYNNTGVASSTLQQQYDRMALAANAGLLRDTFIHWDGSINGYGSVSAYMALKAQQAALLGHSRIVFVSPVRRNVESAQTNADTSLIQAAMAAAYPNNYYDAHSLLVSLGDPVDDAVDIANNVVPTSLLQEDEAHLLEEPMVAVATAVAAMVTAMPG